MKALLIKEGLEKLAPKTEEDIYEIVKHLENKLISKASGFQDLSIYKILDGTTDWLAQDEEGTWYVLAKYITGPKSSYDKDEEDMMWIMAVDLISDEQGNSKWRLFEKEPYIKRLEARKQSIEKTLKALNDEVS